MKYLILIFFLTTLSFASGAQISKGVKDSIRFSDTSKVADTIKVTVAKPALNPVPAVPVKPDTTYKQFYKNPYLPGTNKPLYLIIEDRPETSKDNLFYLVSALLLFLAFVKLVFPKYFQNIFTLFFQPSFRQKQTREQLLQNNLPSLFYNLFFLFTSGAYLALLFQFFHPLPINFFLLFAYCTAAVAVLYFSKFIFLLFSGWLFNIKEAMSSYIFIIYLINKIIGILLIPFILILAFSNLQVAQVGITVSLLLLLLLFLYRYLLSFAPVTREIRVSPLHFFFYICAFEIVPLLLIYKLLADYLHRSL